MPIIAENEKSQINAEIDALTNCLSPLRHGLRVNDSTMIIDAADDLDSAYDSLRASLNSLSSRLKAHEATEV